MHSEQLPEIEGARLENIPGTKLWEVCVNISCSERNIKYYYCIIFDSSVKINFGFFGKVTFVEKTKEFRTVSFYDSTSSSLITQMAAVDGFEEGFHSHCCYILKSVKDGEEQKYMAQLNELKKFSFHFTYEEKEKVMTKIIKECSLYKRASYVVLVCFLSQICKPMLNLQKLMDYQNANTIFHLCSSISIQCIPPLQQGEFVEMMEQVYKCAYNEGASFLSFCNFMYPCLGPEFCLKMLSKWRSSGNGSIRLLPPNDEYAKQVLKSVVRKMFEYADPQSGFSKEDKFLENLQRTLTFDFQIYLVEELMLNKGLKLDTPFHILHSACERKLAEFSKKGDIVGIIYEWNKIVCCAYLDEDKMREKTEKYLLESLDKAQEHQLSESFAKLEELCMHGTLFIETDSKTMLLRKCAISLDVDIHSLVAFCLKDKTYHDIPRDEVENIVLTWFEHASEHHCGKIFKGYKPSDSLLKLYSYVGDILLNDWFQSDDKILKKLKRKAFEYLKEVGVEDIVKTVAKMEKKVNAQIENIFIDHVYALLKEGIENEDILKQELFEQTKHCEVNST